jgi:GntR family transcriptional regulator
MLSLNVDRDDAVPLHDQVAAQIRRAIADGEAVAGERLPPARHLAAVMHVNSNTVLRALRILRDEGLLELRQGRGIRVTGTVESAGVITKAIELVHLARVAGYTRNELHELIAGVP